ncbi:hypothetical protein LCGC14_2968480, partial [marine sediment metagenome]
VKRKPVIRRPVRVPKRKPVKRPTRRRPVRVPKRKPVKRPLRRAPAKIVRRRPVQVRRPLKKPLKPPIRIPKKKPKKLRKAKRPKQISYHVLARPLKKKGKKIPKLIRVTKRPITKKRAKDLRNYLVDTSLSRTAKIKSSPRKPSKRILKSPTGYASKTAKKFRNYKIVKGKKKPLPSGKVIERKRHLLDTKQEKRKISLKRRIAQLQKQSRTPSRNTPKRKPLTPQQSTFNKGVRVSIKKRRPSPAQLRALAKGRAKLKKMRKR